MEHRGFGQEEGWISVALQARAEATRRRILDSAVDLFSELGYGETGLADVLLRAGVSKGAFYYHFDSKEAVASAIIQEYRNTVTDAARETIDPEGLDLGGVIRATFNNAAIMQADKTARIGNQLLQALSQISTVGAPVYESWTKEFVAVVTIALNRCELQDGVDPAESAEALWMGIIGCYLISAAIGDGTYERLTRSWRALLRSSVAEPSFSRFNDVLNQTAASFRVPV